MNPRHQSVSGLTLLEILVVALIVSLLAGITLLSFDINNPQRTLEREALRLRAVLETAAQEALLRGAEYGLHLKEKEYQILRFDAREQLWERSDMPTFQLHRLPDHVEMVLEMEGRVVIPVRAVNGNTKPERESEHETTELSPHLLMFSSGELTPFDIFLNVANDNRMLRISGDGIRPIRLEKADHAG